MSDYSYQFEWDTEYCYPNSKVLINKLNIQDAQALASTERELTSLRLAMAKIQPIPGHFDRKHLMKIHKYLFSDVYPWAGKFRKVDIAKGNQFCLVYNLTTYADNLFGKLETENYLIASEANVPERLAWYLSELNVLHPFREGNGRVQRLFIEYLALVAGYAIDFSDVSQQEMIAVSADSFACEYASINQMFLRICSPISKEEQHEAISHFFGVRSKFHKMIP